MKRFTETQKWDDPWFRMLKPEMKLLWQWILDKCDNAGVVDPDMGLASFQIGIQYSIDSLAEFGERLTQINCGKWFIPKFIEFQYGKLSEDCKAHKPIFMSLEKHGINAINLQNKGYSKGINTLQEKEKEKEKEIEGGKARGTRVEFVDYAAQIGLPSSDGEFLHDHFLESGWKRGKEPIKDWKASMRKWKAGKWLPSQKDGASTQPEPKLIFTE